MTEYTLFIYLKLFCPDKKGDIFDIEVENLSISFNFSNGTERQQEYLRRLNRLDKNKGMINGRSFFRNLHFITLPIHKTAKYILLFTRFVSTGDDICSVKDEYFFAVDNSIENALKSAEKQLGSFQINSCVTKKPRNQLSSAFVAKIPTEWYFEAVFTLPGVLDLRYPFVKVE